MRECPCTWFSAEDDDLGEYDPPMCECGHDQDEHDQDGCTVEVEL